MASNYPTNLDALTNPAPGSTMLSPAHSAQHANANDAIEAVQATLGTNPQGGSATVKARIAAAETALTAKASTAYVDALNTAMDTRVDAIESTTSFSSLQSAWQADDAEVRAVADAALVAASSGGAGDSYSINVKSFGALGNGTTNDTTAIQAALDAVPATGGSVVFPPGSYLVSAPLVVKSYTHIKGTEPSSRYWTYSTSLPTSACNLRVADGFSGATVISIPSGRTAMSIQGITILGRNVGTVNGITGTVSGTEHALLVRDVNIIGMGGNGITGGFYAARFDTIYVGGCQGWGVAATERFSDTFWHNSYIAGNKAGGLSLAGSSNSGLCSFSQMRVERSGFDSNNPTSPSNSSAPGIYIRRLVDSAFLNCQTDGNTGNGVDISCSSGANLYNVHFTACDFRRDGMGTAAGSTPGEFAAIKLVGQTAGSAEVSHVSFVDCTTQHAKASDSQAYPDYTHPKYGVWMEKTSFVRIQGGRIQGQTSSFYAGGGALSTGAYRPQMSLHNEGYMTLPLGNTASRPASPLQGQIYYDTTLNAPIWWTGSAWQQVGAGSGGASVDATLANAKGDIFAASADNTPAVRTVGEDGQVLVGRASTSTGLAWADQIGTGVRPWSSVWFTNECGADTSTNFSPTQNQMYAIPLQIPKDLKISTAAVHVTTAVAATTIRLGIYADGGSGAPSTLLADFGTVSSATTGAKASAALGSSVQLRSGLVWAVMVLQGGTGVAVRAQKHPLAIPAGDETVTLSGATTMWVDSTTISGALPGTFTVPSGPSGAVAPALALRRSTT